MAIVFVPLILFQAFNKGLISKIFKTKLFTFLGEISFAIYVLQVPVFEAVNEVIDRLPSALYLNTQSQFYFKITILMAVASFSYFYIEKPLRNRIKAIRLNLIK